MKRIFFHLSEWIGRRIKRGEYDGGGEQTYEYLNERKNEHTNKQRAKERKKKQNKQTNNK